MVFVDNTFYLAVLFYVLSWFSAVKRQVSIFLLCMGLVANFFSIAGRYYLSFPLMPMYQTPFFLPIFIGLFSIKIIWNKDKMRVSIISVISCLSIIAVFFPNDFYLPFLKSKTIFSHIFFLSGVMAKACFIIAGVYSIHNLPFYKKELYFDRVTNTLSMFVERHCNAVQICLMAVIKKYRKSRKNSETREIPVNKSIDTNKKIMNWIITGFALWTISMFSGEIWSFLGWGNPVAWDDAAILTTMATWLYYVCFLHLHFVKAFKNYQIKTYAAAFGTILILILNFYPELGIFQIPRINRIFEFPWMVL